MTSESRVYLMGISRRAWIVWYRNWKVFFRTYMVNFLPPLIEPIIYLLAFGFGVGSYIQEVDGVSYVRFIAPALVAISVMYSAFFECTYGSYVRMYYQKTFDAIIATPINVEEVIAGELLWGATRSFIYGAIMLLVLIGFGVVELPDSLLIIPFSFLAGLLFAALGMCFTAITPGIDALNYPSFLFITPMFLLSGTFFPLNLLPPALQILAYAILPLTHVVNVMRSLTLSMYSPLVWFSLVWILVATGIFSYISIYLMKKRLIV
jgi:lipooligosaccharide transport system permease protein